MREVVAESEKPVMLYSSGQGQRRDAASRPQGILSECPALPTPARRYQLEVSRDVRNARPGWRNDSGMQLIVHQNPDAAARGHQPVSITAHCTPTSGRPKGLKQALTPVWVRRAFGGARRDEEKSRAKERIFSFRSANQRWDPRNQRPELWHIYNSRKTKGESIRVFPLSNWTELDVWQYIHLESIPIVPLVFFRFPADGGARWPAAHGR